MIKYCNEHLIKVGVELTRRNDVIYTLRFELSKVWPTPCVKIENCIILHLMRKIIFLPYNVCYGNIFCVEFFSNPFKLFRTRSLKKISIYWSLKFCLRIFKSCETVKINIFQFRYEKKLFLQFWDWRRVLGLTTCFGIDNVFRDWQRVLGLTTCFGIDNVFWDWQRVLGLTTCLVDNYLKHPLEKWLQLNS